MKKFYYFEKITEKDENALKNFDGLTASQFDELTNKAREAFRAQDITAKHGARNFDRESAFISSADSLHGFYFPSAELVHNLNGFKLLLIAFKDCYKYNIKEHKRIFTGCEPVAIYQDASENHYIIKRAEMDTRPLEEWRKDLKSKTETARAEADAWRKVARIYKKDGAPFANFQKNFENCRTSPRFTIYGEPDGFDVSITYTDANGYGHGDTLRNSDASPLKNIDDVLPTIKKYIDHLTDYANECENLLQHCEAVYFDTFGAIFEKILKYQTPSNADGLKIDFFLYKVRKMLEKFYF